MIKKNKINFERKMFIVKKSIEEIKADITKELIDSFNTHFKDYPYEKRLEMFKYLMLHRKEFLEAGERFECKEKNFEELKERIPDDIMSFYDLDDLLKDNGYYSMLDFCIIKRKANKYKILYKAADNYHHDLLVTYVEVNDEGDAFDVIVIDFQKVSKKMFKKMFDNKKILEGVEYEKY